MRFIFAVLCLLIAAPALAQDKPDKKDGPPPGTGPIVQPSETGKAEDCDGGTLQLLECMEKQRAYWDKKLNAAYKDALSDAQPDQKPLLRSAQRAWIQFRDTNCDYYQAGEGSLAKVSAIWCLRDLTEKRARELAENPYE
jgi:uncharacterized protein YecT (DUF1311 family)